MIEDLLQIELAYEITRIKTPVHDPIEEYYRRLNATIEPIEPESDRYKLIERYIRNTHAKTHSNYSLEILNVFKVKF